MLSSEDDGADEELFDMHGLFGWPAPQSVLTRLRSVHETFTLSLRLTL
jgi:hypothetical protein